VRVKLSSYITWEDSGQQVVQTRSDHKYGDQTWSVHHGWTLLKFVYEKRKMG